MTKKVKKKGSKKVVLKATHSGFLNIGSLSLPCYVLEDGTRVLTQGGAVEALGMNKFAQLPKFISNKALQPFITNELNILANSPIVFYLPGVGRPAKGYKATILADVCDAVLQARKEGKIKDTQKAMAEQCEILTRSFAKVGIIALIDEATGYQEIRSKDALQALLDKFLLKEFATWAKRFPDDFYREMFRLKGWNLTNPNLLKRPGCVGTYTNDIVYDRLAPELLEEIKARNPKDDKGNRKAKFHQFLTEDIGHPALSQHLHTVISFMKASTKWDDFKRLLERALPKKNAEDIMKK